MHQHVSHARIQYAGARRAMTLDMHPWDRQTYAMTLDLHIWPDMHIGIWSHDARHAQTLNPKP